MQIRVAAREDGSVQIEVGEGNVCTMLILPASECDKFCAAIAAEKQKAIGMLMSSLNGSAAKTQRQPSNKKK